MVRYCLSCRCENAADAHLCSQCGRELETTAHERRLGIAFMLNELEALFDRGIISGYVHGVLRRLYLPELRRSQLQVSIPAEPERAPQSRPVQLATPREPAAPQPVVPGWMVEQQANLLLYLGAFLTVIAALVFVNYSSGTIPGAAKMALLSAYTLAFVATGVLCARFPRVRQAGVVFFAVGALMVPLNFVAAYVFFFSHEHMDPTGLWLAGSITSALFYGAVSMLGLGRWYPFPATAAVVSAFIALLVLADAPAPVYPASAVCLAVLLAAPSLLRMGRFSDTFGLAGQVAAHVVVPGGLALALLMGPPDAHLWLNMSLAAAFFYVAASLVTAEALLTIPALAAIGSALGTVLFIADAPPEAYPGSFIALALVFSAPSLFKLGRLSEVFSETALAIAHALVPLAAAAAGLLVQSETAARWYVPLTGMIAVSFYAVHAYRESRSRQEYEPLLTLTALSLAGATAVSIVYALDRGPEWYGPATIMVGWVYALGSEGIGPRWFGQRYLGWLAVLAVTASWLFLEGQYVDFPRQGAGVHFAAVAFYLCAARLTSKIEIPVWEKDDADSETPANPFRLSLAVPFVYAAALTLSIGFFYLLSSLPAAETAGENDLAWPYFGLSLGIALTAAAARLVWPLVRPHAYVCAVAISFFVLLTAVPQSGQVALLLALYTGVSLAFVLWEREPLALAVPASYGFLAVLATWRHFEPEIAALPVVLSEVACYLYLTHVALTRLSSRWSRMLLLLAFAYAVAAPITGWVRLDMLAGPNGFVGTEHFEKTLLYEMSAASLLVLGLLVLAHSWLARYLEMAVGASALIMVALLLEIGHFRPENVQAYTAPLGAYLLALALLSPFLKRLPEEVRALVGPLEAPGAVLIMAPSFLQSLDGGGWQYGVILLAEGIAFVVLAVLERRLWLLTSGSGFVVADALHYLFFAGGPPLPNWAILAVAGAAVMAAGTLILLGRDRWMRWHRTLVDWWNSPREQAAVRENG